MTALIQSDSTIESQEPILSPRVLTGDQIHRTGDVDIECGRGVSERDLPNFPVLFGGTY